MNGWGEMHNADEPGGGPPLLSEFYAKTGWLKRSAADLQRFFRPGPSGQDWTSGGVGQGPILVQRLQRIVMFMLVKGRDPGERGGCGAAVGQVFIALEPNALALLNFVSKVRRLRKGLIPFSLSAAESSFFRPTSAVE